MSSANLNGKSVVIDQSKAEAFAGRMLDVLNSSLLGLMISIGHQTPLQQQVQKSQKLQTSMNVT